MKIGIVGGGTVGRATARTWLEHCEEVRVYDHVPERSTHSVDEVLLRSDLVFICLPEDRLDDFFQYAGRHNGLAKNGYDLKNYVLKSTVPIGTTRRLLEQYHLSNLVHSPEFLTARCAVTDAQIPARNIIGVPIFSRDDALPLDCCALRLWEMYKRRFPGVSCYLMSSDESEAVKLAVNSFFAVKVAFWNELRSLCDALHLDWETVRTGILSDGRICSSHTQVPGPDGKRGFGGTCLPKDLQHFIDALGYPNAVVSGAAKLRNELRDRRKS